MDRRFPDDAFPVIVAHRGAPRKHPENTLLSFEAALSLGAPVVELDVRLTADRVPVVMHDPDVSRTTDGEGFVHELSAARVAGLNAGTPDAPVGVPTLAQVLELVSGRAAVALEVKNIPGEPGYEAQDESIVAATLGEVQRVRFEGPVLVLSFNPRSIAAARSIAPDVATGFLTTDLVDPDEALSLAGHAGHDFVLPGSRALGPAGDGFVERAHADGVRVGTWTVDDPAGVETFLAMGVDAIASNDPGMALEVLAARPR